jgi:hypothetical protein
MTVVQLGALAGMRWNIGPHLFLQADVGALLIPSAPRFDLAGEIIREVPFVVPSASLAFGAYVLAFGDSTTKRPGRSINLLPARH